jgi:tRNA A37 threonylcarbamoyladenosine dehydratase
LFNYIFVGQSTKLKSLKPVFEMKITVIGAGNVGATVAECAARKDMVEEIVLPRRWI